MMIDEDKQAICDALCKTLQLTIVGRNLERIEYKCLGPWTDRAFLHFSDGNSHEVNISMDSGAAMIRDIMREM